MVFYVSFAHIKSSICNLTSVFDKSTNQFILHIETRNQSQYHRSLRSRAFVNDYCTSITLRAYPFGIICSTSEVLKLKFWNWSSETTIINKSSETKAFKLTAGVQNPDIAHTEASWALPNFPSTYYQLLWNASQTLFEATPETFATKTRRAGSGCISRPVTTISRRTNKPQGTFPTLPESYTSGWLLSIPLSITLLLNKWC